jgi:thiol-disulfide isomerase/thioredoxin
MRAFPRVVTLTLGLIAASLVHAAPVELNVTTLDGKAFAVSDHAGQWIVVNYWATWCGPCIKEMPELDALDRERDDVLVLGLAFEDTSAEDLQRFLGKHPVQYAIAQIDVYAPPEAFAVPRGLPTTHLLGPDGTLRQSFIGPVTRADLERAIASNPPEVKR